LETARNLSSTIEVLIFEDAQGKIELGVVILKQLDEGLHLGRAEVETGAAFCGFDEASNGVGVFDVGKEIQNQEVDVLDFVVSEFDTLRGGHFGGDVPADAKSVFVSFVNDRGHQLGLNRAVDFDLYESKPFVVIDRGASFGFSGHEDFGWTLERAATVHDSGQDDARSQLLAFLNTLAAGQQQIGVIPKVADRCDPAARFSMPSLSPTWACISQRPGSNVLPAA
jgi:hypothetical protein